MKQLIVMDTHVILSVLHRNKGKSFELVSKITEDVFNFAISVPLILEYKAVLKRKLDRTIYTDSDIEDFINYLCTVGIKSKLFYLQRPYLIAPSDDHIWEVTIQSNARTILTYNKKDFKEAEYFFSLTVFIEINV